MSKTRALNNQSPPKYIAVEGPIGVGKTSLSRRLAESFNYELLLEKSEENPFLDRFYEEPKQNALSTQLFSSSNALSNFKNCVKRTCFNRFVSQTG